MYKLQNPYTECTAASGDIIYGTEHSFGGCLGSSVVNGFWRCSARRAHSIREFNPHKSQNIFMDYVSTVVEKDKCRCCRLREIS